MGIDSPAKMLTADKKTLKAAGVKLVFILKIQRWQKSVEDGTTPAPA